MENRLVVSLDEARDNIERFASELGKGAGLEDILAYTRAWYALRNIKGEWIFAPSKFAGYAKNTARDYVRTHNSGHDGRATERALRPWFEEVKPGTPMHAEIFGRLQRLFADLGKTPNSLLRISVLAADLGNPPRQPRVARNPRSAGRVTVRPDVCGGRPCIRGMRIRVSDILDLLAAGEDRAQILSEYPYLESEDIDAALAYAARTVDHRIIEAA